MHVQHTIPDLPLSGLTPGQSASVSALSDDSDLRRRFQDLGLIPGARVDCLSVSPLGDPKAYRIRGAVVALRAGDAEYVRVTL